MTFTFENFPIYKLALKLTKSVDELLANANVPKNSRLADQLIRASLSIPLNIAEGAGRYHKTDKKNYKNERRVSQFVAKMLFIKHKKCQRFARTRSLVRTHGGNVRVRGGTCREGIWEETCRRRHLGRILGMGN